jgi:hypothetical protein
LENKKESKKGWKEEHKREWEGTTNMRMRKQKTKVNK